MRGGEPQPAAEGAGGAGPPSWGCGGLCRRLVLWFPLPAPRSLGVRGGGLGAWPAGGAGARKARQPPPEPEPTTPADQAGRLWLGLRETVGRGRAGCGRERGHCVPHPPTLRGVMAQAPFPSRSPRTQCPRPSQPERCRRWDFSAFLLLLSPD